ncbi:MAG: MarR family winged helix-turn-helix transcriptional regulator [Gaiellaceae bacterium]
MPRPRRVPGGEPRERAADALALVAPLVARWIERLLAAHDPPLTVAQFLALEAAASGDVAGADLARRAAVSPAAVSQLLSGLEEVGLLQRLRSEADHRRQPLTLTSSGVETLRSARHELRLGLGGALAEIPSHESDALADALERVGAILGGLPPPRRPPRPPGPKHRRPPH